MSELAVIGPEDAETANEIVARTYELLHSMELIELSTDEVKTPDIIGVSGVCVEVSDVVTRAAHQSGVLASRELHEDGHFFTSFAPLDRLPEEEDLIMCLTWGQFNPRTYKQQPGEFFGKRRDICPRIGRHSYEGMYASWTTEARQVAHAAHPARPLAEHIWLDTTPKEVTTGSVPLGEVALVDFPEDMWEPYPISIAT